jgi:hypothetical protein
MSLFNLGTKSDRRKLFAKIRDAIKKGHWIEFSVKRPTRTLQQNKYLHVCLQIMSSETGYLVDELKQMFAKSIVWMHSEKVNVFTGELEVTTRSTASLSDTECVLYIDLLRLTASEMGIDIPTSEEYLQAKCLIDQKLENETKF